MLRSIKIRDFKSILRQDIEFGRVNVLIGCNGAGKSNILEAIGVLSAALSGDVQYSKLAERGVRLSSPDVFKSALKAQARRKPLFTLGATFDNLVYSASIRATNEDSSSNPFNFQAEILKAGRKKVGGRSPNSRATDELPPNDFSIVPLLEAQGKLSVEQRSAVATIRDYAIFAPSTPILRGVAPDESRRSPLGLYGGGLDRGFAELLKMGDNPTAEEIFKLFGWITSIGVRSPSKKIQSSHIHTPNKVVSFVDRNMTSAFNRLYAYDVSEGALYVFFVLLLLSLKDAPPIFALDNVDNALNPGMVRDLVAKIVRYSEVNGRQVFMTTHNPTALDAIDIFDNEQRIFVVKRTARGATVAERLMPPPGMTKETWAETYSGMRLSSLWIDGLIEGALPPRGF